MGFLRAGHIQRVPVGVRAGVDQELGPVTD